MGKKDAEAWLDFAKDDLDAAKYLLGMEKRSLEIICYHCQQCAEKALKGLYALEGVEIPRTHDFGVLVAGIKMVCDVSDLMSELAQLQPFAVSVRYPYEMELLPGDDEKAISSTDVIYARCMKYVNLKTG